MQDISNNWIDFLSMIATVSAASYGIYAISSWKHQKDYEIKMEIFAMSRRAKDLVKFLRQPVSFDGEMDPEIIERWFGKNYLNSITPLQRQLVIFQSRLKFHHETYKELLLLRERIWANFSHDHIYYKFYDYVISTIIDQSNAHSYRLELSDKDNFPESEFGEERKMLRKKVTSMSNDEINTKLEVLFDQLIKMR